MLKRTLFFLLMVAAFLSKSQDFAMHHFYADWADTIRAPRINLMFLEDTLIVKWQQGNRSYFKSKWGDEVRWKQNKKAMRSVKLSCCDSLYSEEIPNQYKKEAFFYASQKTPNRVQTRWENVDGNVYVDTLLENGGIQVTRYYSERFYERRYTDAHGQFSSQYYSGDTLRQYRKNRDGDTTWVWEMYPGRNYTGYPLENRWDNWYDIGDDRIKLQFTRGSLDSLYKKNKHIFSRDYDGIKGTSFFFEEEFRYRSVNGEEMTLFSYVKRSKPIEETKWGTFWNIESRFSAETLDYAWTHVYYKKVCETCYPKVDSVVVLNKDSNRVATLYIDYSNNEAPVITSKPKRWIKKEERARHFMFWPHPKPARDIIPIRPQPQRSKSKIQVLNTSSISNLKVENTKLQKLIEEQLTGNGLSRNIGTVSLVFLKDNAFGYLPQVQFTTTVSGLNLLSAIKANGGIFGAPKDFIKVVEYSKGEKVKNVYPSSNFIVFIKRY